MRMNNQSPLSPLNFMLNLDSPCSLPPLSPPPVLASSPSASKGSSSLRQRRTGLSTVLETGKTVCFRVSSLKVRYLFPTTMEERQQEWIWLLVCTEKLKKII